LDRLIEAVLPCISLPEALPRLAEAWREHSAAGAVLIGALDRAGDQLTAAVARETGVALLPTGRAAPGALRSRMTELLGDSAADSDVWIPLAADGAVFGGVLIGNRPGGTARAYPPDWITVTARLLAHVRELDDRLRNSKLAAMAEFAAGAGHEINNPLGSILICAEKLLREERDPERRRLLSTIGGQAYRIRDMIGDAMLFARPPAPDRKELDLAAVARDVLEKFAAQCAEREVRVTGERDGPVTIVADRVQVSVVVSELLRNALQAVEEGGAVRVDVQYDDSAGLLIVADNGRGLSPADREHLFDPFYSGRQAGRGLGFGLSKCWRIVTQHGGEIEAGDEAGGGVRVRVRWPGG
jgi:hypothetical protein